jgi:hypothetical protein
MKRETNNNPAPCFDFIETKADPTSCHEISDIPKQLVEIPIPIPSIKFPKKNPQSRISTEITNLESTSKREKTSLARCEREQTFFLRVEREQT